MASFYPGQERLVDQPHTFVLTVRLPAPLERRVTDLEDQARDAGMPSQRYKLIGALLMHVKFTNDELVEMLLAYNTGPVAAVGQLDPGQGLRVVHGRRGRPSQSGVV
jgi:hypothetical protein